MVFHKISIIEYTSNERDFQCGKRDIGRGGGNNWTDLTCLTRAFSASLPAASAMRKSLFAENATLFIGETFDSIRVQNKRQGGTGRNSFMQQDGSRARCAFEKSFRILLQRILLLTFLRFAQPAGTTCVRIGHEEKSSNLDATTRCRPAAADAFHRPILFADTLAHPSSLRRTVYY